MLLVWWGCICWNYQTWLVMIQYSILIPSFCLFNQSSFGGGITWCLLMPHDREIVYVYVIDKYPMFCAASRVLAIHFFDSVRVIRINWIRESIFSPASVVKRTTKSQRGSACFCDTPITFHIENLRPTTASLPLSFAMLAINTQTEWKSRSTVLSNCYYFENPILSIEE